MSIRGLRPEGLVGSRAFIYVAVVLPGETTVYVGGHNAVDADGEVVGSSDVAAPSARAVGNGTTALATAGASLDGVVQRTALFAGRRRHRGRRTRPSPELASAEPARCGALDSPADEFCHPLLRLVPLCLTLYYRMRGWTVVPIGCAMPTESRPSESPSSPFISSDQREQFVRDGFVRVSGLVPTATVESSREAIAEALELDESDPTSWEGKPSTLGDLWEPTVACKTEEIYQAAGELVGSGYSTDPRGYSPYREARGMDPWGEGFIPVLRYPEPGPAPEGGPHLTGWHIDGMHLTPFWPTQRYLVLFVYLSDVSAQGGATVVRPGSHRQVFERGYRRYYAAPEAVVSYTEMSDLQYREPVALEGQAGDVLFMHYLMVHSGSLNYDRHVRYGLNSSITVDSARPYRRRDGAPEADWTPLDYTLRVDNLPDPVPLAAAG